MPKKREKQKLSEAFSFNNPNLASLTLRIGLAFVFVYAAVSSFKTPNAWIGYIPAFTSKFIQPKLLLDFIAIFQIFLSIALIVGRYLKYTAAIAVLLLIGIVIGNTGALLITFRDIGLAFMAIALIFLD